MDYLLLIIGWVSYGLLHSFLASNRTKEVIQSAIPGLAPYYRLAYNIFAILSLLLLLLFQSRIDKLALFESSKAFSWIGISTIGLGLGIILIALRQYDLSEFSGLNAFRHGQKREEGKLATHGLSALVRHPLYTGTLFVLWGLWIYDSTLSSFITAFFLSGYIRVGIYYEELKLVREFGDAYRNYQKQVPMLFPSLFN